MKSTVVLFPDVSKFDGDVCQYCGARENLTTCWIDDDGLYKYYCGDCFPSKFQPLSRKETAEVLDAFKKQRKPD